MKDYENELRRKFANLTKAISLNPNDANAYKERANVCNWLGDHQRAVDDFTHAIRINPNDCSAYNGRSFERKNLRDYKGAIEDCNKAIQLDSNSSRAYDVRAELYYLQGEYESAIEDSDRLIQLSPYYPPAYYRRGKARSELRDYEGAINDYEQAIRMTPSNFDGYYNWAELYSELGYARAQSGDDKEAIEDYNKAIQTGCSMFQYHEIYNNRGNSRFNLGDLEGAIDDYNHAIRFNLENAIYYINRGNAYSDLKNYQKAVKDYNYAINIVQNYPDVYEYRGIARYHLGDKVGAIEDLEKAAVLYEKGEWIQFYQKAMNLIYYLSVTEQDATIEDIEGIINAINDSPTEENINYYASEKVILNPCIEHISNNNNQGILEKTDHKYLGELKELIEGQEFTEADSFYTPKSIKQARDRITVSIARRQGQPQFRQSLLEAYNYRCAITGCNAQEALEAAHIIPYSVTENNHPSNGLLMRADIHTLFDLNLIAINPETMQVHLSPSLRLTSYREINGISLQLPNISAYLPKKEALKWRCGQCEWYKQE